jgi:hypothetical protein
MLLAGAYGRSCLCQNGEMMADRETRVSEECAGTGSLVIVKKGRQPNALANVCKAMDSFWGKPVGRISRGAG